MLIKKLVLVVVAVLALFTSVIIFAIDVPITKKADAVVAPQVVPATVKLELELSKDAHYNIFTLSAPPRLAIDIKGGAVATKFDKSTLANTPITEIRTGKRDGEVLRIVFDLKSAMTFKTQELAGDSAASTKLVIYLTSKK